MKTLTRVSHIGALLLLCTLAMPSLAQDLEQALQHPERPEADKERDAARKPAQVIEFLGIEPGMRVLDAMAGGGFYTEVLSLSVGPNGRVISHNFPWALQFFQGRSASAIKARTARLDNVEVLVCDLGDVMPPPEVWERLDPAELPVDVGPHVTDPSPYYGRMDAAFTGLNLHDVYIFAGESGAQEFLREIYQMLKPGGVLGLTDHRGDAQYDNHKLHRITDEQVRDFLTDAGFVIEAESDLLANPQDDHSLRFSDPSLQRNTDRILIRARKPKANL